MPTDTADVAVDDPDGIDSNCSANPLDANGPATTRCGVDAVTYAFRPGGHRVYLCRDHAEAINRFDDDAFRDGHPTIEVCKRCHLPTPRDRVNQDTICEDCQT